MKKIKNHYDTLKLARDAPPEVIRAAYRSLSQKYHPDKNQGDIDAEKIMQSINIAYQTLSDPELREQYDKWIEGQERQTSEDKWEDKSNTLKEKQEPSNKSNENQKKENKKNYPWRRFFARTVDFMLSGILLFLLFIFFAEFYFLLENPVSAGIIIYLLWMPVEAGFLSITGTTPAKWIFGISVLSGDGSKLSYLRALERTFLVFLKGEGLSIPFVVIFTRISAYLTLEKTSTTSWDNSIGSIVIHKKWGITRAISSAIVVILTLLLNSIIITLLRQEAASAEISNKYQTHYNKEQQRLEANVELLSNIQPITTNKQQPFDKNLPQKFLTEQQALEAANKRETSNKNSLFDSEINYSIPVINQNYNNKLSTDNDQTAPLLIPLNTEKSNFKVSVKMTRANIRISPSSDGNIIGTVKQGDQLSVFDTIGDYYLINTSIGKGFIHKSTVQDIYLSNNTVNARINSQAEKTTMDSLPFDDQTAIEMACITQKSRGAAAYRSCLNSQLNQLEGTQPVNLGHLSSDDQIAIEMACITQKSRGVAAYRSCLNGQLNQLKGTQPINLGHLSADDQIAIEMACITQKSRGAAAYRSCLKNQLNQLKGSF